MYLQDQWKQVGITDTELPILKGRNGLKCIFRSQINRHEGIFNEYLAYKIGQELNYSIPKIEFTNYNNDFGSISHFIPDSFTWDDKRNTKINLDVRSFAQIIIFDMWIGNTNRGNGNLLVKKTNNNESQIYMIDHELSLYIHDDTYMKNLSHRWLDLIKISELKEFNEPKTIYEEYKKIKNLPFTKIRMIVDQLVSEIKGSNAKEKFTQQDAEIVKNLLNDRKKLLKYKLEEWFEKKLK